MAGSDLFRKIIEQTSVSSDQGHIPVLLHSLPNAITDRTAFLEGHDRTNPAYAMIKILSGLKRCGATVAAIPCNTAHSPRIFDIVRERSPLKPLHMIEETAKFIEETLAGIKKVGLLCTLGTYQSGIYTDILKKYGLEAIVPSEGLKESVHAAIYDGSYGIKAHSSPVTKRARMQLLKAVQYLRRHGAQAVVLGCTELPLAFPEKTIGRTVLVDPTRILARALIRETAASKLRPLQPVKNKFDFSAGLV